MGGHIDVLANRKIQMIGEAFIFEVEVYSAVLSIKISVHLLVTIY